jgi:arylsulfatase A-like enzyme
LLIVADTLRADRLGSYGSPRGLTPFLDEFSARGTVFANAYAPSSWTCPSIASLFTSRYPLQHRVSSFESKMTGEEVTLAEKLTPLRYATAGFSANNRLTRKLGYAQGFAMWQFYVGAFVPPYRKAPVRAGFLRQQSLRWLDAHWNPSVGRPVFLYLQYMDTHTPYDPPQPFRRRFRRPDPKSALETRANEKLLAAALSELSRDEVDVLQSLYDGEVAYLDAELRQLFAELRGRGFLENAIVVVTSDHGEEFREHGRILHGFALYEESIRVPLILVVPGYRGGRVVEQRVSLIDLAPTILDLIGLPAEERFEGRSLVPFLSRAGAIAGLTALLGLDPPPPESADVILELAEKGSDSDDRGHATGIIRETSKVLVDPTGRVAFYDLALDPHESHPGDPLGSPTATALADALGRARAELAQRANKRAEGVPLEESEKQHLRELGYLVE